MENGPAIPQPARGARWRWASSRGAVVGGGALAALISVGTTTAGAATPAHAPLSSATHGMPPARATQPTTAGKITALTTDAITIQLRSQTTQTVTYSASTTFRTLKGTTSVSALTVGKFISVAGTKHDSGSVAARSIMIGRNPPPGGDRGPGGRTGPGGPPKMPTGTSG